jgi:hypothetical protein
MGQEFVILAGRNLPSHAWSASPCSRFCCFHSRTSDSMQQYLIASKLRRRSLAVAVNNVYQNDEVLKTQGSSSANGKQIDAMSR